MLDWTTLSRFALFEPIELQVLLTRPSFVQQSRHLLPNRIDLFHQALLEALQIYPTIYELILRKSLDKTPRMLCLCDVQRAWNVLPREPWVSSQPCRVNKRIPVLQNFFGRAGILYVLPSGYLVYFDAERICNLPRKNVQKLRNVLCCRP